MKKFFLFLIALVGIVACSKSDSGSSDNGGGGSVAGYNPPDWIIGTWINEGGNIGYLFTKKDYCITAGTTLCYLSGSMKQTVTKVEQEIKGDIYTLSIEVEGSIKAPFSFKRISANQIATLNLAGEQENIFTKK